MGKEKKNKEKENKDELKPEDKVIIGKTPRTEELRISNSPGIIKRMNGEDVYVLYTGYFGPSGPYKLKIGEVEKDKKEDKGGGLK